MAGESSGLPSFVADRLKARIVANIQRDKTLQNTTALIENSFLLDSELKLFL